MKAINLAVELRSGRHYGVFIDDTGSLGLKSPSLNEQRKTWVAVLVPPLAVRLFPPLLQGALRAGGELPVGVNAFAS